MSAVPCTLRASDGRSPEVTIDACHPEVQPFLNDYRLAGVSATGLLWDVLGSVENPGVCDLARTRLLVALACFDRDRLDDPVRVRFEHLTFAEDRLPDAFHESGAALLAALGS